MTGDLVAMAKSLLADERQLRAVRAPRPFATSTVLAVP